MINQCSSLFLIGLALLVIDSDACQPVPEKQMELIRERFRTATVLFPRPELQNLTSSQLKALNETIDQLIRLQSPANSLPYDVEQSFLRSMRGEAVSHNG